MTHGEIVGRVVRAMPYPDQMGDFTFDGDGAVRFMWRGDKFRVSPNLSVEQIETEGFLTSTNMAILLQKLIQEAR